MRNLPSTQKAPEVKRKLNKKKTIIMILLIFLPMLPFLAIHFYCDPESFLEKLLTFIAGAGLYYYQLREIQKAIAVLG